MNDPSKWNVLVVGHDQQLVEFVRSSLENGAYDVRQTDLEGEKLAALLKEYNPDVIIVDVGMPAMRGIEVSLEIRQWSVAPTVLLSTWKAGKAKVRGFDLDSSSCLGAPIGADELTAWLSARVGARSQWRGIGLPLIRR